MAMTKKRISGILLAVALFVGVFAATPAFAATTTTVKEGITIDWSAETLSWNNGNLSVKVGKDKAINEGGVQTVELENRLGSDLTVSVTDLSVTPNVAKTFTLPKRPTAPAGISSVNGAAADLAVAGISSIAVNSPAAAQDYAIAPTTTDNDNDTTVAPKKADYASASSFEGLLPATGYRVYSRIAPVVGTSFASAPHTFDIATKAVDTYFIYNDGSIGYASGYKLYADTKFTTALREGASPKPAGSNAYVNAATLKAAKVSTFYLKKANETTYITISYARPAAPTVLPKFELAYDSKIIMAGTTEELKAFDGYQFAVKTTAVTDLSSLTDADFGAEFPYSAAADATYYIYARKASTGNTMASEAVLAGTFTGRPAYIAGAVRIDAAAAKIYFGLDEGSVALEANTKADFTGKTIKSGDSIADLVYSTVEADHLIYFRNPAVATKPASMVSGISTDLLKDKKVAATPAVPTVTSTEETITITNNYVSGIEFSVDGVKWQEGKVFAGLEDGKEYTVYARTIGDKDTYPSVPAKATIKTIAKKVVTFKNGATVVATSKFVNGAALVYPAAPKKTGYKFAGWDVAAGTAVTDDMTVNAQWKVIRGLKTIRKSAGSMTPAFKISQKTYKVVLSKSTSSVKLVAKRRSTAQVVKTYYKGKVYKSYYKTVKLARGASTTVKFYVKAADGKTTTYYVKVVRK